MEDQLNEHCRNVMEKMYEMTEKNELCDTVFCLDGNFNIYCHKNILASNSKVLEDIIKTVPPSTEKTIIDINNVSSAALKRFMKYVYLGTTPTETEEIYQDFLKLKQTFCDKEKEPIAPPQDPTISSDVVENEYIETTLNPVVAVEILDFDKVKYDGYYHVDNTSDNGDLSDYVPLSDESAEIIMKIQTKTRNTKQQLVCKGCSCSFTTRSELNKHRTNCEKITPKHERVKWNKGPPFRCPFAGCEDLRETKDKIRYHYRAAHMRTLQCPICPLKLHTNSDFKIHVRRHNGERPLKCGICNKGYMNQYELNAHIPSHTRKKRWEDRPLKVNCPTCGEGFASNHLLYQHIVTIHKDVKKRAKLNCDKCDKTFTIPTNLRKHKKHCKSPPEVNKLQNDSNQKKTELEEDSNKITCDICEEVFDQRPFYNEHVKQEHGAIVIDESEFR